MGRNAKETQNPSTKTHQAIQVSTKQIHQAELKSPAKSCQVLPSQADLRKQKKHVAAATNTATATQQARARPKKPPQPAPTRTASKTSGKQR